MLQKFIAVAGACLALGLAGVAHAATLSLSPAAKNASVGDVFTVDVMLDTQGRAIDGVDIKSLNYNPYYLQLQDADPATSGAQINAGSLMPNTVANSVDTANGKIMLSQITNTGSTYNGNGKLASITFKALVAGTATVNFDFTSGITTDSNVASQGSDILSSVTNGQYVISNTLTTVNGIDPVQSTTTMGSAGSLRLINYNGTYYLVVDGVRHGITLPGMLFSYGFALSQAKAATADDMALPEGDILLPGDGVLVKTAQDKTVWLISGSQRHGFTSAEVFTAQGFKFSQVLTVTAPELNKQPVGANVDSASAAHLPGVNIADSGTIYWVGYDGKRYPYPSLEVYNSWNVPNDFTRVLPANAADQALPVGGAVTPRLLE